MDRRGAEGREVGAGAVTGIDGAGTAGERAGFRDGCGGGETSVSGSMWEERSEFWFVFLGGLETIGAYSFWSSSFILRATDGMKDTNACNPLAR